MTDVFFSVLQQTLRFLRNIRIPTFCSIPLPSVKLCSNQWGGSLGFGREQVSIHISVRSDLISVQPNSYWPLSESAEGAWVILSVCVWVVCTSLCFSNVWLNIKVSCQLWDVGFCPVVIFLINLLCGYRDISDWLTKCRSCDNTATLKGLTSGLLNVFCLRETDILCSLKVFIWLRAFDCT